MTVEKSPICALSPSMTQWIIRQKDWVISCYKYAETDSSLFDAEYIILLFKN
jgi:hypothetical protein